MLTFIYNNINIYDIFYIKNITLNITRKRCRFKYKLRKEFLHIHILEYFNSNIFKIRLKYRYNEGSKHLKKPKAYIENVVIKPLIIGLNSC
jgi:hypothetical protein